MADGAFEQQAGKWTVRYRDASGRRRRQGGFRTKAEARVWNDKRLEEKRAGIKHDSSYTFRKLCADYLAQHDASEARITKLRHMLDIACDGHHSGARGFGDVALADITAQQIGSWRKPLAEGTRHDALAAVKQVLRVAVLWKYLPSSPADGLKNPVPTRKEFIPFDSWDEIEAIEESIRPHYRGVATVATGTGLRPQEWTKLDASHIDLRGRVINLPAQIAKDKRARKIPLRQRVVDALAPRVEGRARGLVFTTEKGGAIDIRSFRRYVWAPALVKAGLEARRPYDMRHTFATWALRAGLNTFTVARRMGTSLQMIDETYGHHATDSEAHELLLMDAFDGAGLVDADRLLEEASA